MPQAEVARVLLGARAGWGILHPYPPSASRHIMGLHQ